ncbi:MAG: sulfotransferase [Pirellulales bacterium]|nr:sulfotransferase [Pirellulales bacterium]
MNVHWEHCYHMFEWLRQNPVQLQHECPVVVMARGHSGTRLLALAIEQLGIRMGANDGVPTGDVQDRRFTRAIKRICRASLSEPSTAEPNPRLLRAFHRSLVRYLDWLGDHSNGWGWKFPETYLIPNYVAATFPQARYVHMIRDGRDLAFKNHLTDDPHRRLGRRLLRCIGAMDMPHHVQAAMSWQFQVERYEQFVQANQPRVLTITFESLCHDPLETMRSVSQFLEREFTDECRSFLQSQVRPEKVAQFRRENIREVSDVEAVIRPTLQRLGYIKQAA